MEGDKEEGDKRGGGLNGSRTISVTELEKEEKNERCCEDLAEQFYRLKEECMLGRGSILD